MNGKVLREVYVDAQHEEDDVGKRFLEQLLDLEEFIEELVDKHPSISPVCRFLGQQAMEIENECGICGREFEEEDSKVIDHCHYSGRQVSSICIQMLFQPA